MSDVPLQSLFQRIIGHLTNSLCSVCKTTWFFFCCVEHFISDRNFKNANRSYVTWNAWRKKIKLRNNDHKNWVVKRLSTNKRNEILRNSANKNDSKSISCNGVFITYMLHVYMHMFDYSNTVEMEQITNFLLKFHNLSIEWPKNASIRRKYIRFTNNFYAFVGKNMNKLIIFELTRRKKLVRINWNSKMATHDFYTENHRQCI